MNKSIYELTCRPKALAKEGYWRKKANTILKRNERKKENERERERTDERKREIEKERKKERKKDTVLSTKIWVKNHITVGFSAFLCSVGVW